MNKKYFLFAVLFLFFITSLLSAFGRKENVVQVTGIVRLTGNAPFYEIIISGSNGEWYITRDEAHMLNAFQHRTVTVEGVETVTELKFANGLPAGKRRELSKIKIITIH